MVLHFLPRPIPVGVLLFNTYMKILGDITHQHGIKYYQQANAAQFYISPLAFPVAGLQLNPDKTEWF